MGTLARQLLCACLRSACVVSHVVTDTGGEIVVSLSVVRRNRQNQKKDPEQGKAFEEDVMDEEAAGSENH